MKGKKILGYCYIVLAGFLILGGIGQLPNILNAYLALPSIIMWKYDAEKSGELSGTIIFGIMLVFGIIMLLKYGKQWTKQPSAEQSNAAKD